MYRTKTYIAGDWTGDSDAVNRLYTWNEGDKWKFHFVDAHNQRQCYDTSMPCTIKASLSARMNISKTFVLIVGDNTATTRKGSCAYQTCANKTYDYWEGYKCKVVGKTYSTESFIDYECRLARAAYERGEMKIVVLYNATTVDKSKCPESLRNIGDHVPMKTKSLFTNKLIYDYQRVRSAIEN